MFRKSLAGTHLFVTENTVSEGVTEWKLDEQQPVFFQVFNAGRVHFAEKKVKHAVQFLGNTASLIVALVARPAIASATIDR